MPADGGVDADLANQVVVEKEIAPGGGGDGVGEDAVGGAGAGVHTDQQDGVASLFEQLGVPRPGMAGPDPG